MAEREQLDDRALVARILEGDRDRFTELVRRYEKRLINYVYRITHRYEEAHDLAQGVRPGVGPAGGIDLVVTPGQLPQRPLELRFHGSPPGLLLPAREAGPVVLQHDFRIHF